MALSQRLEFRQTQGLVMTPQLMQAIKLLQLSSLAGKRRRWSCQFGLDGSCP
jgi:Sigma-54 factor, Activator interacting domain (AID)